MLSVLAWSGIDSIVFPSLITHLISYVYTRLETRACVFLGSRVAMSHGSHPVTFKQIGFIAVREREIKKGKEKEKGEIER